MVAQGQELSFGLRENHLKFLEEGRCPVHAAGPPDVLEPLGKLDDAFRPQVKAHALQRVRMKRKGSMLTPSEGGMSRNSEMML